MNLHEMSKPCEEGIKAEAWTSRFPWLGEGGRWEEKHEYKSKRYCFSKNCQTHTKQSEEKDTTMLFQYLVLKKQK